MWSETGKHEQIRRYRIRKDGPLLEDGEDLSIKKQKIGIEKEIGIHLPDQLKVRGDFECWHLSSRGRGNTRSSRLIWMEMVKMVKMEV